MTDRSVGAPSLRARDVRELLGEIGSELAAAGSTCEIALYGGGAIVLQFDYRASTMDLDVVVAEDDGLLLEAAEAVGRRRGMPDGWFNDAVSMFQSHAEELVPFGDFPPGLDGGGLRVLVATPAYLLAMKLLALQRSSAVTGDLEDVWHLSARCGVADVDEAAARFARFYPGDALPPRTLALLGDAYEAMREGKVYDPVLAW